MQRLTHLVCTIFQVTQTPKLLITPPDDDQRRSNKNIIPESPSEQELISPPTVYDCNYLHPPDSVSPVQYHEEEFTPNKSHQKTNEITHCQVEAEEIKTEGKRFLSWDWVEVLPVMAIMCFPSKRRKRKQYWMELTES